nr:MAG TPA: hypothetical protein [Caudoviricetes sp.]
MWPFLYFESGHKVTKRPLVSCKWPKLFHSVTFTVFKSGHKINNYRHF